MPGEDRSDVVTRFIEIGRDRDAARYGSLDGREGAAMDTLQQLDQLGGPLGAVVAGITPEQLDRPTPCANFTVRGVLEHMVGGATAFTAAFRGEAPPEADLSDPLASFGPVIGELLDTIREPGSLEKTIQAPFGEVTGDVFARFVVLDGLVHGWDMATATGQAYDPPAALVAEAEAFARQTLDPLRDGDTFADAVEPAPGSTPIERLAAYTGRRP
jgi:uncharacterized protein (TIGR03086 family)